ncbi:hypothetical protein DM02DRAFT_652191 [Periconia macrospinosa]|uniref:Uncharacterized protein n=1 Tax=Periconia macrospinosa TaxID=97972 RepID=A0A2V1DZN3_9PLEO|nr:hypothetical protein DM02DRAFT_652191 [Periconia macrospinosa]
MALTAATKLDATRAKEDEDEEISPMQDSRSKRVQRGGVVARDLVMVRSYRDAGRRAFMVLRVPPRPVKIWASEHFFLFIHPKTIPGAIKNVWIGVVLMVAERPEGLLGSHWGRSAPPAFHAEGSYAYPLHALPSPQVGSEDRIQAPFKPRRLPLRSQITIGASRCFPEASFPPSFLLRDPLSDERSCPRAGTLHLRGDS